MKLKPNLLYVAVVCLTLWMLVQPSWGQRNLTDIPKPDPAAEMAAMRLDPRIEINLYAADPLIRKPIQMNFDGQGRLWVASSETYPQIEPGAKANDKIIVLNDSTGDGVADQQTVFADGLLIPTGVLPGDGGVYVANSTELLHLKDTDDDGVADQRRIVLSGFGTEDTHHLLHTLRWGPDGCMYMNQSIYIHSHIETPYGTKHLNGGGIWRFRPETGELEVLCKGFVNPWGHIFNPFGQSFATDGAYVEGINYVFPGSVFVTSPGAVRHLRGLNPGSPKHCGLEILSGTHIPADWQGDMVTNDFRGHRVCRFTVQPQSSGYVSRQQPELIASNHVAFRPIDARMGPDGAIYIADWYNPIIQHGEVDFRDERRDQEHGRIWRLTFKDSPLMPRTATGDLTETALLHLLESPALWLRQFARLELKSRDATTVLNELQRWIDAADAAGRLNRQAEAMWVRECLNQPDFDLLRSLASCEDHRFRAIAVRYIGIRRAAIDDAMALLAAAIKDPHPQVRLEAVSALGRFNAADASAVALAALDQELDSNLDFALWNTLHSTRSDWIAALADGSFDIAEHPERLEFAVAAAATPAVVPPVLQAIRRGDLDPLKSQSLLVALCNAADSEALNDCLAIIVDPQIAWNDQQRGALIEDLSRQMDSRNVRPSKVDQIAKHFDRIQQASPGPATKQAVLRAIGRWKLAPLQPFVFAELQAAQQASSDPTVAIDTLGRLATDESLGKLSAIATDTKLSLSWRIAAIDALVGPRPKLAARQAWALMSDRQETPWGETAIRGLLRRKGGADMLTEAVADSQLPSDAGRAALREVQAAGSFADLEAAIRKAGRLDDAGWKMSDEQTKSLTQQIVESGDPAKGEAIYRRSNLQCIACHAIGPAGGRVGPNFVSLGGSAQIDYLIESLIDPSAKVKENFHSLVVLTLEGTITQGIRDSETDQSLVLRLADTTKKVIPKDTIDQISEGRSLMAAGLVDGLTRDELVHLVRFLSELGRTPAYTLSTEPIVRSWQLLTHSSEANHVMNRTSIDSVANDDPVFVWENLTAKVDGTLPLKELPSFRPHRATSPLSFVRFEFESPSDQPIELQLPKTDGLKMWVDSKPTPIWDDKPLRLKKGKHQIILAIDRDLVPNDFKVKVDSELPLTVLDPY